MKNCAYSKCGQEFEPNKSWQTFCSNECRRQNWEEQQTGDLKLKVIQLTQVVRHVFTCRLPAAECRSPLHIQAAEICSEKTTDKEVRAAAR